MSVRSINPGGICGDSVAASAEALLAHPVHVALQRGVGAQCVERIQAFGERHLVVQAMQRIVACPAQVDTCLQRVARHAFAEEGAPMQLARDQVMEGELGVAAAQAAGSVSGSRLHGSPLFRCEGTVAPPCQGKDIGVRSGKSVR